MVSLDSTFWIVVGVLFVAFRNFRGSGIGLKMHVSILFVSVGNVEIPRFGYSGLFVCSSGKL